MPQQMCARNKSVRFVGVRKKCADEKKDRRVPVFVVCLQKLSGQLSHMAGNNPKCFKAV